MKNINILLFLSMLFLFSYCNSKKEAETTQEVSTTDAIEETPAIEGYDTIEELAASVLNSLKERDYQSYYIHIMDEEMELEQASKIEDSVIRKEFLTEYGFSLHEEEEYFKNLLHFFDSKNIDLNKAVLADMEYIEYKGGEYQPLELYEVFIPIEMDYELLIDFTAIKVGDKYYLTSELGI